MTIKKQHPGSDSRQHHHSQTEGAANSSHHSAPKTAEVSVSANSAARRTYSHAPGHVTRQTGNSERDRASPVHPKVKTASKTGRSAGSNRSSPDREISEESSSPTADAEYNSGDEYAEQSSTTATQSSSGQIVAEKCSRRRRVELSEEIERRYEERLKKVKGLIIKKMQPDGACLFRAVADQVYGDQEMHGVSRRLCMDYIGKNSDYFSEFVTEDIKAYVARKRQEHVHGNHVEIQAMAELFNRTIHVYEYNVEPLNTFHAVNENDFPPIRVSYHAGCHYNSVVDPYAATIGVGLGLPQFYPGLAEKNLMSAAINASETEDLEAAMLQDKLAATDSEATESALQQKVLQESYMDWVKTQSGTHPQVKKPHHLTASTSNCGLKSGHANSPKPSSSKASCSTKPAKSPTYSPKPSDFDSAVPGPSHAAPKLVQSETASFADQLPLNLFGLSDWGDETDILTHVMAISQQEYINSLKRAKTGADSGEVTSKCEESAPGQEKGTLVDEGMESTNEDTNDGL